MRRKTIIEIYHDDEIELNAEFMECNIIPSICCANELKGIVRDETGSTISFVRSFDIPRDQIENPSDIATLWEFNTKRGR